MEEELSNALASSHQPGAALLPHVTGESLEGEWEHYLDGQSEGAD